MWIGYTYNNNFREKKIHHVICFRRFIKYFDIRYTAENVDDNFFFGYNIVFLFRCFFRLSIASEKILCIALYVTVNKTLLLVKIILKHSTNHNNNHT